MPSAILRKLRFDDLPAAFELAKKFHAESWYADLDLRREKIEGIVLQALNDPSWLCVVAADSIDDRPVGFMMVVAAPHFFGNDICVTDVGLYLLPEYRRMSLAVAMLREVEAWARIIPAKEITLGITAGINDEGLVRLYNRMGYAKSYYGVHKKAV